MLRRAAARGAPFSASRRRLSPDAWAFSLEFAPCPGADLYGVVVALAGLLPGGPALRVAETPTRTELRVAAPGAEVLVAVPRVAPLETRVSIELTRAGPDAGFAREEVDALLRAQQLMRPQQGVAAVPVERSPLLDGKGSVDVGPPTRPDRPRAPRDDAVRIIPFEGFEGEVAARDGEETTVQRARAKLEELGVDVFDGRGSTLSWDALAGYDDVKRQIDNTLTLPLRHPHVYEAIVRGTRERYESNLPKAVLYEGPPGCGKTLSAKILSVSIGVPFVHVPLETILSKYYGETTRKLAEILQTANELGPCLVFIDECDSIGLSRSSSNEIHEVTRRTLSVLLRHIDGLEGPQNTILLAATNHKEDIDPALMSRFDVVVSFPLPDLPTREAVLALYAKHLTKDELRSIAELSSGFSGRELLDVCEEAERTYAGYLVRESVADDETGDGDKSEKLPRLSDYVDAIKRKAPHVVGKNQRFHAPHGPRSHGLEAGGNQTMTVGPAPALAT